jgi:hypothetical protein
MGLFSRGWQFCLSQMGYGVSRLRGNQVISHDPTASMPHDLDDPFHSAAVQEKVGQLIADAQAAKRNPKPH